jgi:hypothetical protein
LRFLYNLFIQAYYAGISLAALWNQKAAQWKAGRKNLWAELEQTFSNPYTVIWIHSASAGEFEQAKPMIEALKNNIRFLLRFFRHRATRPGRSLPWQIMYFTCRWIQRVMHNDLFHLCNQSWWCLSNTITGIIT